MLFSFQTHGKGSARKLSLVGLSLVLVIMVLMLMAGCSPTASTPIVPPAPANTELILSSTTSVRDSGLMDKLIPLFEQKTGYQVKPLYNGSGAALDLGAKGEADVLLVHSADAEVAFMQAGNGTDRILLMHNDFIIAGPSADPAKIKGSTTAIDAFKKIADARANFYSRGDNSGTDAAEKKIWKTAGIIQTGQSWYFEAKLGMGDLLRVTSEKSAYTLTDRATYLANQKTLSLDILVQGDPVLINVYHVIQVNPSKSPKINVAGAKAFSDFMVGKDAQDIIGQYTDKNGQLLFTPDGGKADADLGIK